MFFWYIIWESYIWIYFRIIICRNNKHISSQLVIYIYQTVVESLHICYMNCIIWRAAITVNLHASSSNNIQKQMNIFNNFLLWNCRYNSEIPEVIKSWGKDKYTGLFAGENFPFTHLPMPLHSDVADHTICLRHNAFVLLWLLEQRNNNWVFFYDSAKTFLFFANLHLSVSIV
jgi:hypothetical protein